MSHNPFKPPMDITRIEAFCSAAYRGQIDDVREFLKTYGSNAVNVKNSPTRRAVQQPALMWATLGNQRDCIHLLLEFGASVTETNNYKLTPLHQAVTFGDEELMKLYISKGADVNAQDWHGETPLYRAAQRNHEGMIRILLKAGADPDIQDYQGRSPRQVSIERGAGDIFADIATCQQTSEAQLKQVRQAAAKVKFRQRKM